MNMKSIGVLLVIFLVILHIDAFTQINMSAYAVWYAAPGSYPTGLGSADADGNGWPDLVIACGLDVENAPVVVYFNYDGILQEVPGWTSSYYSANGCLYLGDLDHDGDQDLAVASLGITDQGLPPENHAIFYNNNGFTGFPDWLSPLGNGFSCTGGDVDGDGDIDLVFGQGDWLTSHLQKTKLFLNNDGIFDTIPAWETDSSYYVDEVVFADVDMDGDLDLAIGNERTVDSVGIAIFNNNNGVLETSPSWSTNSVIGGRQMAFGDADQDGYLELAVASPTQNFYVFDNENGILDTEPCWSSAMAVNEPSTVAWADADGDDDLDLAVGSWFSRTGIFENNNGVLADTFAWSCLSGTGTQQLSWCDIDGDYLVNDEMQFLGHGNKKLYYFGRQHLVQISSVEINDTILGFHEYCFDLENGWISLANAPGFDDVISVHYTYSRDLDLAMTNWSQARIYDNLNSLTGITKDDNDLSPSRIGKIYPNPMKNSTSFTFQLNSEEYLELIVYNLQGQKVKTLQNGLLSAGEYTISWDGTGENGNLQPDGIYFCRFITGINAFSQKVLIAR